MSNAYYIGKRRKRCRLSRPKSILLLLALSSLAIVLYLQSMLLPQVRTLCETNLSNRLEALASREAYQILSERGYSYTDFVLLHYSDDGSVRSASVDTVKLNLLENTLALRVLEELVTEDVDVAVPVRNLFGLLFFSGLKKEMLVTARVANGMRAKFHTVFTDAGINQTRHAIGFSLDFTATYLLPTGKEQFSFSVEIPIGETLIVGDVPESLTQINRFAEDISEIEIDDAVDFGNVLS